MEEVSPYVKLTQTPLAQQTKCCGIRGGIAIVIAGVAAIIISVIPGFVFAAWVAKEWGNVYPNEKYRDPMNGQKIAAVGMLGLFSGIHLVISILVIVGGATLNTKFVYVWLSSISFMLLFGRIGPIALLSKFDFPRIPYYLLILILGDLIVLGLMIKAAMHMTAEARNANLLRSQFKAVEVKVNTQSEAQVSLLPAGSYPRM